MATAIQGLDCPGCLDVIERARGYPLRLLDPHYMPPAYTVTVLWPTS